MVNILYMYLKPIWQSSCIHSFQYLGLDPSCEDADVSICLIGWLRKEWKYPPIKMAGLITWYSYVTFIHSSNWLAAKNLKISSMSELSCMSFPRSGAYPTCAAAPSSHIQYELQSYSLYHSCPNVLLKLLHPMHTHCPVCFTAATTYSQ